MCLLPLITLCVSDRFNEVGPVVMIVALIHALIEGFTDCVEAMEILHNGPFVSIFYPTWSGS